jgi:hypothetical protein
MSSCVFEFRDHLYLFGFWWFLCKTWRFTPCPNNIHCKFLPKILRGYISSPGRFRYSYKHKALNLPVTPWDCFFIFAFLKFFFKNLIFILEYLQIILSLTAMSQKNWSIFCLNLKGYYCVIVQKIITP